MHCLFWPNVGDVKMMPLMSYMMNIMRILGHKIFCRNLKIISMSIRTCNVECIVTQQDYKRWYQKRDFHLSTRILEFSCLTRNTIRDARNILNILPILAKMPVLSIWKRRKNYWLTSHILWLIRVGGAKLIVHSIFWVKYQRWKQTPLLSFWNEWH